MYEFYEDPGHGWLKVPRVELLELGIEDKISPYSYVSASRAWVYLEEDGDLTTYVDARVKAAGKESTIESRGAWWKDNVVVKVLKGDATCRRYARYEAPNGYVSPFTGEN